MASSSGAPDPVHLDAASQQHQQAIMKQGQAHLNKVVDIMQANVSKVMERNTKQLEELDAQGDELSNDAQVFGMEYRNVRRKMWWQNLKFTILLGLVVLILIIIINIAIWIDSEVNKGSAKEEKPSTPKS